MGSWLVVNSYTFYNSVVRQHWVYLWHQAGKLPGALCFKGYRVWAVSGLFQKNLDMFAVFFIEDINDLTDLT